MPDVQILNAAGEPFNPSKSKALAGGSGTPYDAASISDPHMDSWNPLLWSPDNELNPYRDRIVSRVRDLVRNDGWASAAVTRTLDNVIGADFRPIFKPDYYALRELTGIKGFDHVWAEEFGRAADARYRSWAMDANYFCDVERTLTVAQMFQLSFRHKLIDGDALAVVHWKPKRVRRGAAQYATTLQIIDPDRLSNPNYQYDTRTLRGGVEIDEDGAPTHFHIRMAHQGDWFNADKALKWERIPRETAWGRTIVVHDFDHDRAAQHRGGAGILAPVLHRLKMLIKYDGTELDAAIVNAIFGAFIESPFDQDLVEDALGGAEELNAYQGFRTEFHKNARIKLGGVRMPILAPGEKINTVAAERPNSNFAAFESAMLRNVAAGTGMSAQQISQNWAEVNYSSYRAAMLEAWKTFGRRRSNFGIGFGQPIAMAWMEEAFDRGQLPLPAGAPDFIDARSLYARAKWMGPGRGYVDDVKEKEGAVMGMSAGLSTLEEESATLAGRDWRETLDQRAIEIARFKSHGIALPEWAFGQEPTSVAREANQQPEK